MGLSYTSVKSKSQELIKEKPDRTGQSRTKSDKVKTAETAKQKISNEIESHQTVACLLKEAMILQEKAEFNVSRIMVSLDKGTSVIQINGATENGDSVQLIQIKQKNPLPFRTALQNEQGTSRVNSRLTHQ